MASTVLWKGGKKKKNENRICSRSDDRSKVAAQEGRERKKSNRKLGASVQFLAEIRSFRGSRGLTRVRLESRGGAECVSGALQDRWSLGELHRR